MKPDPKHLTDKFVASIVQFNNQHPDPEITCEFTARELADACLDRLVLVYPPAAAELSRHSMRSVMGKSLAGAGFKSRILKGYRYFRGITPEAVAKACEPPPTRKI